MERSTVALITGVMLMAATHPAQANAAHGPQAGEQLATRFEQFVLANCSPCITESYPVATLVVPPPKLPAFPRSPMQRPGELAFEVLRAYSLGRASRQFLAIRVTLSVAIGSRGELYRLATGVLDEEEVGALVGAIGEIARSAAVAPADRGAAVTDIEFHGGSMRIGLIRIRDEAVAYVQAGDVQMLALRPVWEVSTTLYLPPSDLPSVAGAVGQLAARIKKLRGD